MLFTPSKDHIIETQATTAIKARNLILGYQTPDFQRLAYDILNQQLFTSDELQNYRIDDHYLPYLPFYEKGSELFPDSFEMYYFKGVCYLWLGRLEEAKDSLHKALVINPYFFWTYYNLALLYLRDGQPTPAIHLLSIAENLPIETTESAIREIQAFAIIWFYMTEPQIYIHQHLIAAYQQVMNPQMTDIQQWHPVFF